MDIKETDQYQHGIDRLGKMLGCKLHDIPTWARERYEAMCKALHPESHPMGSFVILAATVAADVKMGLAGQRGLRADQKKDDGETPDESEIDIDQLIGGKSPLASMTWRKAALEQPDQVRQFLTRPALGKGKKAVGRHALKWAEGQTNNDIQAPVVSSA